MAGLQFKTRDDSLCQGKPRVYFSCHPEDFDRYFKSVCDDLFEHSNCAVYYYTEAAEPKIDADYYLQLRQMHLVVIPITRRFLEKENRARLVDLSYAVEQHIPVLPLLFEQGLEELFNQVCGQLQFLNRKNTDKTAISYDAKLQKFLQAVLIDDTMAEKIRGVFDASIFLSYRKKDRQHANQLMRLIHQNEAYRSVAVWYDEFLVPGENFNINIQNALKKSDLFALLVTPNLINEVNYVMTTEYPMAKQYLKPILAAQMVSTDRIQLKNSFRGIPELIDPKDMDTLHRELKLLLSGKRKNIPDSNERNYLIGLAYLNGVDVEVDPVLGIALIQKAADNGLEAAMEELVTIFSVGKGVFADEHLAFYWRNQLLECAQKRYALSSTLEDGLVLAQRHTQLAEAYWSANQSKKTFERLTEAARILLDLNKQHDDNKLLLRLAETLSRVAELYEEEWNYDEAVAWQSMALKVAQRLAENTTTVGDYFRAATYAHYLGDLYVSGGDFENASFIYDGVLKMLNQLEQYEPTEIARRKNMLFHDIGKKCEKEKNFKEAIQWYEAAAEHAEPDLEDGIDSLKNRRREYIKIACLNTAMWPQERQVWLDKAAECVPIQDPQVDVLTQTAAMMEYYDDMAQGFAKVGPQEQAVEFYRQALNAATVLVQKTRESQYAQRAECFCDALAELCPNQQYQQQSCSWQEVQLALQQEKLKDRNSSKNQIELACQFQVIGMRHMDAGEDDQAIFWTEKALNIWEALPMTNQVGYYLGDCYKQFGDLIGRKGDAVRKREYYQKALSVWEQIGAREISPKILIDAYSTVGQMYMEEKKYQQARSFYEKRMPLMMQQAEDSESNAWFYWHDLVFNWENIGKCWENEGIFSKAEYCYQQALDMMQKVCEVREDYDYENARETKELKESLIRMKLMKSNLGKTEF